MIELFDANIRIENRQSSKGNQQKWLKDGVWYKADYTGYEGLAEYMVSHLLQKSSLSEAEYVLYDTELMKYKTAEFRGCKSVDFLPEGWNLITLERLFQNMLGADLVGPLIIAALTGGVGLVALLTAIGASASALSNGQKLNTLYARAEKVYKEV